MGAIHERFRAIHVSRIYAEADLCSLVFAATQMRIFACPVKAFKYLAHEIPVLCIKGHAVAYFIEETGTGWNIGYSAEDISRKP